MSPEDVLFPRFSTEDPPPAGVVSTWYVADGDRVAVDQLLAEVMVDKVSVDVLSPATGVVHLAVAAEVEVPQGALIARVV